MSNNRGNINLNRDRNRSNNIQRPRNSNRIESGRRVERPNRDRNNIQNRSNNNINRRDLNLNRDRDFSNRIDRSRNNVNIGNRVNINNRNIVVNPISRPAWGWNGGARWYPRYNYWGGGFWGAFAIGAVTGGIIGATTSGNNGDTYVENNYYRVEQGTPGYKLLADYQLTQTRCDDINNLVVINGPENSRICAFPNDIVQVGFYSIDVDTLSLIAE